MHIDSPGIYITTYTTDNLRIIRTRPSRRPTRLLITINNRNNRAIRPPNHEERPRKHDKRTPGHHGHPPQRLARLARAPVVVQPHAGHGLEAHGGAEEGADERDEVAEDGDGAGDDVGDEGDAEGAADPDGPVREGVGGEVPGALEDADEDVFG